MTFTDAIVELKELMREVNLLIAKAEALCELLEKALGGE